MKTPTQRVTRKNRELLKVPKIKNRKHRMWVASQECAACGIWNLSQAAHYKEKTGTAGAGDDRVLPLCADSPGRLGCHSKQHSMGEPAFYAQFGGHEKVDTLLNALWLKSGDDVHAGLALARFRK